jgi:rare lipoprotein A
MRRLLAILTVLAVLPLLTLEAEAPKSEIKAPKFSNPWTGMASWYGIHWTGRKTACGGRFDPTRLTVAHPYLKCGTIVQVTSLRTKRSSLAQVTDRGPYEEGREMDVSEAVAKKIGIKKYGVEKIKIEVVQ